MRLERISEENRKEANCFIEENWFTTDMAIRGELIDMTCTEGFAAYEDGEMCGLVTYRLCDDSTLEILSIDSKIENHGHGSLLLETAVCYAVEHECRRICVVTTNDNLNALRFYQKRGFVISEIRQQAVERDRELKPQIPVIGYNGIPVNCEIELVRVL